MISTNSLIASRRLMYIIFHSLKESAFNNAYQARSIEQQVAVLFQT